MYGANETNIVIRLCVTPWTVAHQELIPWTVHGITSPGKNTGVGCHFLFQANHPDPGIGSDGKASACNTGDPGSIPGLGDLHFTPTLQAASLMTEPPGKPI